MTEKGWLIVHARDKVKRNWRLRDLKNHPLDPGWERGDYRICHEEDRGKIRQGDIVLDVVFPESANQKGAPRVVRSMFRVTEKSDSNIIEFDSYCFLDESWEEGVLIERTWRQTKELDGKQARNLIDSVRGNESYGKYSAGKRPKSINVGDWNRMVERAQEVISSNSRGCARVEKNHCG